MAFVEADWDTLMRQAPMTIELFFGEAVSIIDQKFGEGYAAKHPDLVGQLVHAMSIDFATGSFNKQTGSFVEAISHSGISDALHGIASALED